MRQYKYVCQMHGTYVYYSRAQILLTYLILTMYDPFGSLYLYSISEFCKYVALLKSKFMCYFLSDLHFWFLQWQ